MNGSNLVPPPPPSAVIGSAGELGLAGEVFVTLVEGRGKIGLEARVVGRGRTQRRSLSRLCWGSYQPNRGRGGGTYSFSIIFNSL